MTRNKTFKKRVRDRMAKTGERYAAARRHLVPSDAPSGTSGDTSNDAAGVHAATTALRILLRHAGHDVPEPALVLAGGGVGIGVFAFRYDEFSSLFLAGRHLWHDDLAFLTGLARRLDTQLEVRETGGAKKARTDLLEMLEDGPVAAFVDLGTLGHRGGTEAYYVVTVLSADEDAGTARIADLAPSPIEVPLDRLKQARAKHRSFKNRLVRIAATPETLDLEGAISAGLHACVRGFDDPPMKGSNFRLDGLDTLAKRMRGSGKDAWSETFPPGPRLWSALASFYEYVERYGTGGGLMRSLFASSLSDVAHLGGRDLSPAAEAYAKLGSAWTDAANAALPDDVPALAELRATIDRTYDAYLVHGQDGADEIAEAQAHREALLARPFPLPDDAAMRLVHGLSQHVEALVELERDALDALRPAGFGAESDAAAR